ncbi:MAG: GntP family permease [Chitinophagaceae bacterium]|nr:GntP family permease [Chitinophagaceae bacterium]
MSSDFLYILFFLLTGIGVIILLTVKWKIHAFFALFIACLVVGTGVQIPFGELLTIMKDGFGQIMKSLGFLIVLGTALGVLLEHTGSTHVMATTILKKTGDKKAPLAMNITGFLVGLPIFCDSGYIVLSGLNQNLARRTRIAMPVMAASLAAGLYAVHCLIPPHPGAAAAAGIINVDLGKLILAGIAVAIPTSAVGYLWAKYAGKKLPSSLLPAHEKPVQPAKLPSAVQSFLPVIVPILLIALGSFSTIESNELMIWRLFKILGDPVVALFVGVLLVLIPIPSWKGNAVGKVLTEGVEKAGSILVIIGAGGAFGAVLAATKIGVHMSETLPLSGMGIFFPFLLTSLLKTAQGSSTVAIITAASIIQPLLPALGLDSSTGQLLCVLSMGAGSMMISHANDAYFWVISQFSGIDMKTMLRVYSLSTIWMGLTALTAVYLLTLFLL